MQTHPEFASKFYEPSYSALGNEILVQIFSSLIGEVCRLPFKLNLTNADFLDDGWEMPVFKQLEFVPCGKLGVRLEPMDGHAVVTQLDPNGVAAEDDKVELGDVFVTMYTHCVRYSNRHILSWRSSNKDKPVPVGVAKARLPDGSVYRPIRKLLQMCEWEDILPEEGASSSFLSPSVSDRFDSTSKHRLVFLGSCDIGPNGSVQMINRSIAKVISKDNSSNVALPVYMELGELGVTVWKVDVKTGTPNQTLDPLIRHSFPQISSCGRRTDDTNYLAYIAGTSACTLSHEFKCYVFQSIDQAESKYLVGGIAQGFKRTHWTL